MRRRAARPFGDASHFARLLRCDSCPAGVASHARTLALNSGVRLRISDRRARVALPFSESR